MCRYYVYIMWILRVYSTCRYYVYITCVYYVYILCVYYMFILHVYIMCISPVYIFRVYYGLIDLQWRLGRLHRICSRVLISARCKSQQVWKLGVRQVVIVLVSVPKADGNAIGKLWNFNHLHLITVQLYRRESKLVPRIMKELVTTELEI